VKETARAAEEVARGLTGDLSFVVVFASSFYDIAELARELDRLLPGVPLIGCTTAGELARGRMLQRSVVALGVDRSVVDRVAITPIEDARDAHSTNAALERLSAAFGTSPSGLDPAQCVGLVLQDGLSVAEEQVMQVLSSRTNVPFIGGSAGDDLRFEKTFVFTGGRAFSGASALALLRPTQGYRILKTQSFKVLDRVLTATSVDEATRTIREFDGAPAAEAYASAVGVSVAELPTLFRKHPLGVVLANGEPFVRSPQQVIGSDVVFYCQVKAGMALHVLESHDIVADTGADLSSALTDAGVPPRALINFHCILRTLELREQGRCDEYGELFGKLPAVGFSTYGESYIGHINQTSTMLLLL
jgi:hypothetical protein